MHVPPPRPATDIPSYLTAAFAQWLVEQGRSVACIDTDTLNPTLLQYAPLKATHLKLSQSTPEVTM